MPAILFYLIKFSISLSVLYLFYQLALRRLTFYNWNRWFLLTYSLLSFFIPFINISSIAENKNLDAIPVLHYLPAVENNATIVFSKTDIAQAHPPFNYWNLLLIIIAMGIFMMLIRFIMQFFSLLKIKRNASAIINDELRIYEVDKTIVPFSFGNAIFINPRLHTEKEFEEIILHEYVHVKQKHTVDILWSELICIINWFNPFAWLMRHAIRQNLEFIADDNVLQKGFDKKNYQHHLLKVIAQPQYRIANSFNISSLKKRIIMMNKLKTAKAHAIKFLFVLPLIAVLLLAFRDKYKNVLKNDEQQIVQAAERKSKKLPDTIKQSRNNVLMQSVISGIKRNKAFIDTIPNDNWVVKALFIVDGKEVDNSALAISPALIDSIGVFKGSEAIRLYGEKGRNGVVIMKTRSHIDPKDTMRRIVTGYADFPSKPSERSNSPSYIINQMFKNTTNQPIFSVEGKQADSSDIKKQPVKSDEKNMAIANNKRIDNHSNVIINFNGNNVGQQPIFFVDGKQIDSSEIKKLNPNDIESITVLKDSSATKTYGEKARSGVILIKTKKPDAEKDKSHASEDKNFSDEVAAFLNNPPKKIDQPYIIFSAQTNKVNSRKDTITGTADTIILETGVRVYHGSCSTTVSNRKTFIVNGEIGFVNKVNSPMIIYNGKEIDVSNHFKIAFARYKIIAMDQKNAENKYGDKARNGAIEISDM